MQKLHDEIVLPFSTSTSPFLKSLSPYFVMVLTLFGNWFCKNWINVRKILILFMWNSRYIVQNLLSSFIHAKVYSPKFYPILLEKKSVYLSVLLHTYCCWSNFTCAAWVDSATSRRNPINRTDRLTLCVFVHWQPSLKLGFVTC